MCLAYFSFYSWTAFVNLTSRESILFVGWKKYEESRVEQDSVEDGICSQPAGWEVSECSTRQCDLNKKFQFLVGRH